MTKSIFYKFEKIDENEFFFAIRDGYPVTPLHTLIIPQRHILSFFELDSTEQKHLFPFIEKQRNLILSKDSSVTGFNIGLNDGRDAGRSVDHLHIHLIPRRSGDMPNPRGGVRGVIPSKQKYIKKEASK
ncbi:MAG: HIT family protein [Gammaproteobacteria bacterium]|nr:HIT family protein [Gammaproteobacteria bacterium]